MTKYEIAVRLLAEYCDCVHFNPPLHPSKDGTAVDLPMEWCENHCKYDGENANHEETLQCWEKVINDRYEAQGDVLRCSEFPNSSDLISRQAAIDACLDGFCACVNDCVNEIKKLPSAQLEVIRCKDCIYQTKSWCGIKYCEAHGDHIGKDYDYCSNARRNDNG